MKAAISDFSRWGSVQSSPHEINVFYGHEHIPDSDSDAFGGIVKIQDLQSTFSNQLKNPNILYLVSSALPYFPVRMARRAKRSGAKLVINQNGVAYPGWYGEGWDRANQDMINLLDMADHIFYQSNFCKISADKFLGVPGNAQCEILYNPVDTTIFRPAVQTTNLDHRIYLLLAGSHWSLYRVTTALETLQQVRKKYDHVHLRIAGRFCWQSDEQDALKDVCSCIKRLGIEGYVDITGVYTQDQAPALFNQCSILLHTKYNDPCPRLVVEAMACGLPVVYSATGGVTELVGKDAGVGVDGPLDWERDHPPEVSGLTRAAEKVIGDLPFYSKAARRRAVEKFDVQPWLKRHGVIFKQLLQ